MPSRPPRLPSRCTVLPGGGWMKPMSMRRGLPLIMYGPSMSFSMRSPLNGVPVWRHASSTTLVGCRWVSMIMSVLRNARRLEADHARGVVAEVILERVFVEVQPLGRLHAEHLQQADPHARLVRRRIGAEKNLVLGQILGELDDAGLQAPAGLAVDVAELHCPLEGLEAVHAAGLHAEVRHDEVHLRELLHERNPFRRDAV